MQTESINCNNCGAPLTIPVTANYVTCNHCGSQLAVRRNESVAWSEQLDKLDRRTDQIAEQVSHLAQESELARLDRQWEAERESYMITDKHGHRHLPTAGPTGVVGVAVAIAFAVLWTVMAGSMGAPFFFPLFGVLFIVFILAAAYQGFSKARQYEGALRRYQRHRNAILDRDSDRAGDEVP